MWVRYQVSLWEEGKQNQELLRNHSDQSLQNPSSKNQKKFKKNREKN